MNNSNPFGTSQLLWSPFELGHELDAITLRECQTDTPSGYLFRLTTNAVATTRNPHFLEVR
jgi:hypothetical protein